MFLVRICVNTQMRLSLSFLCQFPVLRPVRTQSHRRRSAICVTSMLSCFLSVSQLALHFSSLSCTCNLTSNAFTLAQDIEPQRKTCCMVAERGSCPRCVQTTHHGSSSGTIASSAGADAARIPVCYRTDQDPHVAGKQQRIGGRSSDNDHSAGYDNSRLSLASFQTSSTASRGTTFGSGQKIQRCIYQHSALMHAKFFWSGWSRIRNT